jgi:hypothetical protein
MSAPTDSAVAEPIGPNELAALKRHVDHGLVSSGTRQTLASLIALIESQRAELAREHTESARRLACMDRRADRLIELTDALAKAKAEYDGLLSTWVESRERHLAAEARVTALEAEKAVSGDVLMDPVAVHLNLLRGGIAKPSVDNIAHLYPEVWAMKEALIATLKHFRHPTSAEHETRDKVMAALSHFDDPPLTPMFQALSRSSTEVKNDG